MSSDESIAANSGPQECQGSNTCASNTRQDNLKRHLGLISEEGELDCDMNIDIEQTMREIRALIAVNDEIFSRCMVYARTDSGRQYGKRVVLERVGYNTIYTHQVEDEDMLELVTQGERTQQRFDTAPLSNLPSCLGDTISVKYKDEPYSAFVDYNDFFQKAEMLLHDDALKLLLPKLKDHLESVQVCLGGIDQWVMQPSKDLSFINLNFQKDLTLPTEIYPFDDTGECGFCGATMKGRRDRHRSDCRYNKCGVMQVLVRMTNNHGEYHTSFAVSKKKEQERLFKFIHFVN